jgi:hypothetical protein
MREQKKLWARIVAPTIIGGQAFAPGALVSVDAGTYRSLLADDLAVPSAGPVAAARATTDIHPHHEEETL